MMKTKEFFDSLEKNGIEVTQKYMKISDNGGTLFALPDIYILGKHYRIDFGYFSDYSCINKLYNTEDNRKINPEDLVKKLLTKYRAENCFYLDTKCSCYVSAYGTQKYKIVVKVGTTKSINHLTYRMYFKEDWQKQLITHYLQEKSNLQTLFKTLGIEHNIIALTQLYNGG